MYALPKTGVDTFDGRSDDKGPEPEGLVMAEIDGRFVRKAFAGSTLNNSAAVVGDLVSSPWKPMVHFGGSRMYCRQMLV